MYIFTVAQGEGAVCHPEFASANEKWDSCGRHHDWAHVGHCMGVKVSPQASGITLATKGSRTMLCAWQYHHNCPQSSRDNFRNYEYPPQNGLNSGQNSEYRQQFTVSSRQSIRSLSGLLAVQKRNAVLTDRMIMKLWTTSVDKTRKIGRMITSVVQLANFSWRYTKTQSIELTPIRCGQYRYREHFHQ